MPRRPLLPLLAVLLLAACAGTEPAQHPARPAAGPAGAPVAADAGDALPVDPDVRLDTLDNGLVYYIRRNTEPEDRAELRLAIDAGSILEDEDQLGVAHFLEHMLFNGTRRFPEQDLVDFLERTGMRFGPDVNAYTSFDETVYMLTIPTDSSEIVQQSFDVLEDWAAYATLSDEEIDKERSVVVEEWRLRGQNAQGRIRDETLPVLLHDSRYAERLPIGTPEIIENADYETIRRFYRQWYRPDLMAVVVVGDLDPARTEALIREHFGGLPVPDGPLQRPTFEVPDHDETLYLVATDPELTSTSVSVYYKSDAAPVETVDAYRAYLTGRLFNDMLNERLAEIAREADAPFLGAYASRGGFVRPTEASHLAAQVHEDSVLVGLEAVLTEAERVRAHGFTATELARAKQEMLRGYRRAFDERETTHSASYAREYVSHFLEDEPIPGIAFEYETVQALLPEIDVADVDALADELIEKENRVVIVTTPEKDGVAPPTQAELAAVFDVVAGKQVSPYEDDVSDLPLMAEVPEAGTVVARETVEALGLTEIVLSNGVTVAMKPTDFKEDEVRFTAFSAGGSSLVDEDEVFEAGLAAGLVSRSGVGAFDRTALNKLLAGKVVGVSPYVAELEEGFRGSASPEDLETLFQLIHLYVTQPRADSTAMAALQNQYRAMLSNRGANPIAVIQDSLTAALYGDHPRRRPPTVEQVDTLDLDEAFAIYRDRFADAGDFTFVFVGNFDVDRLTELARTYLGSLPATPRDETWRDVYPDLPDEAVDLTVRAGIGDQSQVLLLFHGPFPYSREHRHRLSAMADVLDIMLREELREEMGGTYSVNVGASASAEPDSTYTIFVSFGTDPDRVDELIDAVFAQIERLTSEGPAADDVAKVQEQLRRNRETAMETNAFWVGSLAYYYDHEDEDMLDILRYDELVEGLTAGAIREAARRYLSTDRLVRAVLYPEGFE